MDIDGINGQLGTANMYSPTDGGFSIFLLGIMPYVSAYILVELFSLFIPFLKKLRSGDLEGRRKLKRISLVLLKTKISIPFYHEKDNTVVDYFQLNLCPSSMAALTFSTTIIMLPASLSYFFGVESGGFDHLRPDSFAYNLISCICIIMFSFLFGWAFLHPHRRVNRMLASGWRIADVGTPAERFILKQQFIYNLPWTIYLCVMAVVPNMLISGANVPFYMGGQFHTTAGRGKPGSHRRLWFLSGWYSPADKDRRIS